MLTLLRVLFGFIIACLVAGAVTVVFIVTPGDLAALPADAQAERLSNAGVLALLTATHSAIFSFPFALLAIGAAELWRLRSWIYYASVGVIVALGGFSAEYLNEVPGEPSILNNYALAAFLTAGVFGGLAYWLFAGRRAGPRRGSTPPPAEGKDNGEAEPVAQAT